MLFFLLFMSLIILQRLAELIIARKNEAWMKEQGGIEFGSEHYPWMIAMHISFFAVLFLEQYISSSGLSPFWKPLIIMFLMLQAARIWALMSLGKFWNTKIIVLPEANVVKKGPYKYIKHPNYIIVAMEIVVIPLIFSGFLTAVLFTVLNVCVMLKRIPAEEEALLRFTNYKQAFTPHSGVYDKNIK